MNGLRPYLSTALTAIAAVVFIHAGDGRADDTGLYGGRTLPSGVPASPLKDPTQLALEPGSAALGADAARLDGERIFGGYRFGPGFALEGTRTRTGTSGLGSSIQTISVAGVGSLPLTDSVTLMSKLGLSYQPSASAGGAAPVAEVTNGAPLYGVGLSVRLRDNVEVRAQTEHFGRSAGPVQGATAGDSVLFGAGVRF
jgi:hypothetical protein